MRKCSRRGTAAALALSLCIAGAGSFNAQANVLDDIKNGISGLGRSIGGFLDNIGVGPVLKDGYDAVTDFIFTYETQPDDNEMENLARSWAVTAWFADEDKEDTNTYYFDNHTLTMVEDLTQIGKGYNHSKTPEGSYLTRKNTGVLKATVTSPTNYAVEWANYQDEMNVYLAKLAKAKKNSAAGTAGTANETETGAAQGSETSAAQESETSAAQ